MSKKILILVLVVIIVGIAVYFTALKPGEARAKRFSILKTIVF